MRSFSAASRMYCLRPFEAYTDVSNYTHQEDQIAKMDMKAEGPFQS
jgi:hypothetical protein